MLHRLSKTWALSALLASCSVTPQNLLGAEGGASVPNSVAIEALSRLKGMDLEANPALKNAVLKVVESTRGTPVFVELVRDFKLSDQQPGLLQVIHAQPIHSASAEAARMLLAEPGQSVLRQALTTPAAAAVIQALGNSNEKSAVPLLQPLTAGGVDAPLRKLAVKALAQTQDGAAWLLDQVRAGKLGDDLKFTATSELNAARWPQIRQEAAKLLPPPQTQGAESLPPVPELMRRPGDPKHGAEVFRRDAVGCIKCHQVNGEGVDFGPALSEIGTKLGKDALYESILDPSAGISFGFEAWQIELKSGDETYGLVASETEDEITVKTQNGVSSKYKKAQIKTREKMKLSIMPAGLQQSMSVQDLVDLVEYLSSLKKK